MGPMAQCELVAGPELTFEVGTTLDEIELRVIRETLRHTKGDKSVAAQLLGISTRTIYRKLDGVSDEAPPFFVLHGSNDSLIPVEQARAFTKRLRDASRQPVVYAEMPFAQHAFDIFGSARAAHAAVAVEQFLAEIYERTTVGPRV